MRRKKRFMRPPEWMKMRLLRKKIFDTEEVSIILGIDQKNICELVYRGRLKPIDGRPYRFDANEVRNFTPQKPGPKAKPKPELLKKFIAKKLKVEGGDLNVEVGAYGNPLGHRRRASR